MTAKRGAKKRKAKPAKKKMGRPSAFRPEYVRMAAKACSLGATDDDLAELFGVSGTTIDNWKAAHPDFLGALKEAKDSLDAQVEQSLFRRAMGWEHEAVKIMAVARGDNQGSEVQEVPYIEHYPGDTTAQIFWLKNRQPAKWRDKQEVEHGVTDSLAALIAATPKV